MNIEEQYNAQYKEIKKRHFKKRLLISGIALMFGLPTLIYAILSYKNIIEYNDFNIIFFGLIGIAFIIIAIRNLFHQSHSEYIELRDLNSAYTHERFRERKG